MAGKQQDETANLPFEEALKRLVAAGLATATAQHTGRRPKTVYAITAAGRRVLSAHLG